jgi:hypothetical protein
MGRFGPTTGALLCPLYGAGEFPQAFCRVAAVWGATYLLRQPVRAVTVGEDSRGEGGAEEGKGARATAGTGAEGSGWVSRGRVATAVVTAGGQRLRCKVGPATYCPPRHPPHCRPSFFALYGIT